MITFARINDKGVARVLEGKAGMVFAVDCFTPGADGKAVAHVRDYRFHWNGRPFQIWSISGDGYELLTREEQP